MAFSPSPSRASAALFAAVLLAFALAPAAAAVTSALCAPPETPCEQMGHSTPAEDAPADGMSCCVDAPDAEDAVVPAPPSPAGGAPTVATHVPVRPPSQVAEVPRRDTGPPGRLHLVLSVLQV